MIEENTLAETLYLLETRAAKEYTCPSCGGVISRGEQHFRHDPIMYAQMFRGLRRSHWCFKCVSTLNLKKELITGRIRIASDRLLTRLRIPLVEVIGAGGLIARAIVADPSVLETISPDGLEELVCDRLFEWGFEPKRTGKLNRKDGGLDVLFWPRMPGAFPFLGGVQVKTARAKKQIGPRAVREFESVIGHHSLSAGLLVTNTGFTPDARWYAGAKSRLLRLRDFNDLLRWARGEFESPDEWHEIPDELVLCPGVTIKLR